MLRLWINHGRDDEPGFEAWALDYLGFATWALTMEDLRDRVPQKLAEYCDWAGRHGLAVPPPRSQIEIVEHVERDEVLFTPDRESATVEEIERTIEFLRCSRQDLLATLENVSDQVLDWDPPYERFSTWAKWRTVRQILVHIGAVENFYYLKPMGFETQLPPEPFEEDWKQFLARTRMETLAFVSDLRSSDDLHRLTTMKSREGPTYWSIKKSLRRMVWHELLHWKSIRRIIRTYHGTRRERLN